MKKALIALTLLLTPICCTQAEEPALPPVAAVETKTEEGKTEDGKKPVAAVETKAEDSKKPGMTSEEAMKLVDKEVETKDAINNASEIVTAAKNLNNAEEGVDKKVLITLLLAAIFKFLLSAIKLTSKFSDKLKEFWASMKGKTVLRLSTLVLGGGVMLVSNLAAGVPWIEALLMGVGAGPGSLAIHELTKLVPMLAKKPEAAGTGTAEG